MYLIFNMETPYIGNTPNKNEKYNELQFFLFQVLLIVGTLREKTKFLWLTFKSLSLLYQVIKSSHRSLSRSKDVQPYGLESVKSKVKQNHYTQRKPEYQEKYNVSSSSIFTWSLSPAKQALFIVQKLRNLGCAKLATKSSERTS